jgi:uncharacterized membrane protein (UPF0127 family)
MAAYDGPLAPLVERSLEKTASIERLMDDRKPDHADVIFTPADATVHAEVVSSPRDLRLGLMFRTDLQSGQGMLFKFPDRGRHSMWMKNTPLSLDMIFMDKGGKVVKTIVATDAYSEKTLDPGMENDWVLEVPTGFVQSFGIVPGMSFEVRPWQEKKGSPDVLDGPDKTVKKTTVQGIPVNIERPKGTIKLFKDKATQFYHNDYGSIPLVAGVDGDPLDVFVGPDKGSKRVFVVDKMQDKDHSKFDEHKVLLGFKGKVEARQVAKKHLWGTDGKIHELGLGQFKGSIGLKTAAEFAPGIPEKGRFVDIPTVQVPQQWEFAVQKHDATRAGAHLDLRLGNPETGDAFSWALKKLPEPGKGTYAPMQPTHTLGYMDFKGEIPSGYGAGKVELDRRSKVEVVKATPNEVRFNLYDTKVPEQFVLKQHGGRMWTLHNVTPARWVKKWEHLIPTDKPSLKEVPFKKLDPTNPNEVYQPKIDGAHGIAVVEGGKPVRFFSYREAKTPTGLIEHTHRMPGWWNNTAPEGMKPSVIRGEIYGTDKKGKPIPAAQVGGLLNTGVMESREKQQSRGIKLHFAAFKVDRHDGKKTVGLDPERTEQILTDLTQQVPGIEVMPTAKTPVEKAKLIAAVSSGKHPLTHEGIVARSVEGSKAWKAKLKGDYDVFIRQVYAGTKPGEAGGFRFSHTQHGPVVGNVGGGFKHTERQEMLLNPEKWIGRVAKVEAEQKFPSGALRAPIFKAPHETKGLQPYHELA